ncbi:MAG: nucleoside phosphorylase [Lachnotalea sp.]
MNKEKYPILEFDPKLESKLEPIQKIKNNKNYDEVSLPECCVITFFKSVIEEKKKRGELNQLAYIASEALDIPIYETLYNEKRIGIVLGCLGAAGAAYELEQLIALGGKRFIVCGGAGVLQKDIAVGHIIIPDSAVCDEGLSYHYVKPAREIFYKKETIEKIEIQLQNENIPYVKGKTWTIDAIFRETQDKIALRKSEGCITVEMEASALLAVAQFRNVELGQILYGGDDLSDVLWDGRQCIDRTQIREELVNLSIRICSKL